jgi:hypothetical protein
VRSLLLLCIEIGWLLFLKLDFPEMCPNESSGQTFGPLVVSIVIIALCSYNKMIHDICRLSILAKAFLLILVDRNCWIQWHHLWDWVTTRPGA